MIGPFTADSNISVIAIDNSDYIGETVVGNFNTCSGDAVTDGYVLLTYGNQTFTDIVSNGTFEINLLRCTEDNTFQIKASDYVNIQTTNSISYTFTTPLTDIGTISACNAVTQFIQYTLDNEDTVFLLDDLYGRFDGYSLDHQGPIIRISGIGDTGNNNCFYLFGKLNDPNYEGTYDYYDWTEFQTDTGLTLQECFNMSNTNNNIIYNLTSLGEVGEYIDINFSGTYEDYDGIPHTISGVVHILRDE